MSAEDPYQILLCHAGATTAADKALQECLTAAGFSLRVSNSSRRSERKRNGDDWHSCDLLLIHALRASEALPVLHHWHEKQGHAGVAVPVAVPIVANIANLESAERLSLLEAGASMIVDLTPPTELVTQLRRHAELGRSLRKARTAQMALQTTAACDRVKLDFLISNGVMLSMAGSRATLIERILSEGQRLLNCDGATMYLVTEQQTLRFAYRTRQDELPVAELPLFDAASGAPNEQYVSTWAVAHKQAVLIDDIYDETRFDFSGTRRFDADSGYRTVSMLAVPMTPRDGEVVGVLQFINALDPHSGAIVAFSRDALELVEALAAQAAVALDNLALVEAQKASMESMIQVIATAIDAKSPYTGRHCSRVPDLAVMLAELASESEYGSLADFCFTTDEEWQEFRIGAWLHDCGKMTTPEYVIDKATKLETMRNQIHEIRTRFEVLLRDAQIERLQAQLCGESVTAADATFTRQASTLADDFAFLAECNIGSETMTDDDIERLQRIAAQTWLRHFDDRVGLSRAETERLQTTPIKALPVREYLLSDKPSHIIPRPVTEAFSASYGFRMQPPPHLYNHGEVYNLSVRRGTLTDEERYKINEHVISTIVMLEQMRFPKSMQRVSEYAGTHHETLTGEGYPRQLAASELSVPARIMAIADIFEALTAPDRPYKEPNKISDAVRLLHEFKLAGQIDPDIFDLFLESGLYLQYAHKYLKPEQIDAVDISRYVGKMTT